ERNSLGIAEVDEAFDDGGRRQQLHDPAHQQHEHRRCADDDAGPEQFPRYRNFRILCRHLLLFLSVLPWAHLIGRARAGRRRPRWGPEDAATARDQGFSPGLSALGFFAGITRSLAVDPRLTSRSRPPFLLAER